MSSYVLTLHNFPLELSIAHDVEQGKSDNFFFNSAAPVVPLKVFQQAPFHSLFVKGGNGAAILINPEEGIVRSTIQLYTYEGFDHGEECVHYTDVEPANDPEIVADIVPITPQFTINSSEMGFNHY
eukprot:TRINITY_DN18944_c0_g1_i1.p1 TRINITY_DN18944_c0_g1~~TRINITY_DN18944_c0_g1_i1.p1  ORF type:complete len:126 (+),score=14.20 TRINITY_DN18944_c0_g1_i1:144-521(+)